jgi:hypothetical protein
MDHAQVSGGSRGSTSKDGEHGAPERPPGPAIRRARLRAVAAWALAALLAIPGGPPARAAETARVDRTAANVADFDFVVRTVAASYSGHPSKTAGDRARDLASLTARLRADVAAGGDLRDALYRWIAWYDDGHLQVRWTAGGSAAPWRARPWRLTEAGARDRLERLGDRRAAVEGLWSIDDRYRLVVLRSAPDARRFDAVVLETSADGWRAGDVKAELTPREDGSYDVRYGTADRSEARFVATLRARGEVLDTRDFGIWRRVQADDVAAAAARRRWPPDEFSLTRLDADTLYLRAPSFDPSHTGALRELVAANAEVLAKTPQLVIDVRGNGGGSDFVYEPLLRLVYTRPVYRIGVELRVSADNAKLRTAIADLVAAESPVAARVLRESGERIAAATTPFVPGVPHPFEIVRLDEVRENPSRVAVLIDRAASSAENFLLDARQSRKVTLMGQENSAGVIDYGEMVGTAAPSGRFELHWATSRSLRLPLDPVDPDGLAPDVRIPSDVDDPVAWAARWLARPTAPSGQSGIQ